MLMFFGKPKGKNTDNDENASRAARLKILRESFYAWKKWPEFAPDNTRFQTVPIQLLLNEKKKLKEYGDNAKIVVLNAHGSSRTFNGYDGSEVAEMLVTLGIKEAGTKEIWVAACDVGHQTQDNSSAEPFATDLLRQLRQRDVDPSVYAPRGMLTYRDPTRKVVGNESVLVYGRSVIRSPEREYPFSEGWVLAHP
ncbi:hypothetical protein BSFA1_53040 [Burkholderia sp. SFA1]|uniref:Uncharacterized protein n=2 Tax=Burkholderiaceae TaxID=119060 RepID=A0A158HNB4_CABCO|nr:hypothetical protein [Caballeronia cordobensis]AET92692.1 hypothetical protein BYI23_C005460 [Burkholderia sp. YI23]BAO90202.1 putative uncharacterized protein [Burkholderia sp. RPE67]BBQ00176.1 hypothetical protein BSFA1_53040 [Burkholderia sp. SFA1]SAL45567.1 hypothetical protein AWB70_03551 [Caballeronia cordobensis]